MILNKCIVLFLLGVCLQSCAMEHQDGVTSCLPESVSAVGSVKKVLGVTLQVYPGYIPGTKLFSKVSEDEAQRHEQALTKIANACGVTLLSPVQDLGLYHVSFREPIALVSVLEMCKTVPGFEAVYDAEQYHHIESTLKHDVMNHRIKQLHELAVAEQKKQKANQEKEAVDLLIVLAQRKSFGQAKSSTE